LFAAAWLTIGAVGCTATTTCDADDACPSDAVCLKGACALVVERAADDPRPQRAEGASAAADEPAAEPTSDAPPAPPPADAEPGSHCTLDDGVIDDEELPTPIDLATSWIESGRDGPVVVDLVGALAEDGVRVWDLSAEHGGDVAVEASLTSTDDAWFANGFSGASWSAPFEPGGALAGVYRRTAEGVLLLGYASVDDEGTLVHYDPPVRVTSLPLVEGLAESQTTDAAGSFDGNPWFYSQDRWDTLVDGRGRLRTPAGTFDVLRLRTVFSSEVPLAVPPFRLEASSVRYTFLAPCLGPVAVVDDVTEGDDGATSAGSVLRLGLLP
jgi:hypothetical protein